MKKRKTYEISVIDKTYSKTISDETKFYTSDTALELGFELKETEYNFDSAEIVLLNIDDRSLVTRPVTKVNNDFVYELDDDIIPHYGEWRGQLRFETGETYVSSPVKFRIENDLSNDRPPQLSDVQSWVSLKRYADKLTDELKQAVLSVEGIEDTFNANELERQSQFDTAEQSRQTTFEANESERAETFESNETTRQSQELEREEAETTRQQAESQRQSTFEVNEVERQNTFENAEQERQSAEQDRVSAESQRKTDHANRSSELAGKADKKQEDWIEPMLINGWVATDNRTYPVGFYKDTVGIVRLRGRIQSGTSGIALQLPAGYRPTSFLSSYPLSVSNTNAIVNATITSTGIVTIGNHTSIATGQGVYLDNISFRSV